MKSSGLIYLVSAVSAICAVTFFAIHVLIPSPLNTKTNSYSQADKFRLSDEDVSALKDMAMSGDGEAAYRVWLHHALVSPMGYKQIEIDCWLMLAYDLRFKLGDGQKAELLNRYKFLSVHPEDKDLANVPIAEDGQYLPLLSDIIGD